MLTEKDYCDYDTSIDLGELGFPLKRMKVKNFIDGQFSDSIVTVLLYEAQKWLREEKGIFVDVGLFNDGVFYYYIRQKENNYWIEIYRSFFHDGLFDDYGKFESYEEALSEGIKEAIKFMKDGIKK